MSKKTIKHILKAAAFITVFCILFLGLQQILVPKYRSDGTLNTSDFFQLEENSIDVLLLGSSQIVCGVDTPRLKQYYGISAFNFCTSGQFPEIEEYYLKEALKTQSPRLVICDVSSVFMPFEKLANKQAMTYFYTTMPFDRYKLESLYNVSNGDPGTVFMYTFPLFLFSSRWKELSTDDLTFYTKYKFYTVNGFLRRDIKTPVTLAFVEEADGEIYELSDRMKDSLNRISEICDENGMELLFLKIPSDEWTRNDSRVLNEFMTENGMEFLDLSDKITEMGLDTEHDFFEPTHLNLYGAAKVSDYLGEIIEENLN